MAAHGGNDERVRALRLQPTAHGAHHLLHAGDTTAPHGQGNPLALKFSRVDAESCQVGLDGTRQVLNLGTARRPTFEKEEIG